MKSLLTHETKRESLYKFLLLLAVCLSYFGYLTWEYDFKTGGLVSILTWSFFVLCTPIADAGFLLDFPVRLITGMRMFVTEIIVWGLAITMNVITLYFAPEVYEKTILTSLFHKILTTPWPYWSIIVMCGIGTFLSIKFGDEMMDVVAHKERSYHHEHGFKHKVIVMGALMLLIVWAYYHLLERLEINLESF